MYLIRAVKARIGSPNLGTSNATFIYVRIIVVLRVFIGRSKNLDVLEGNPYCDWSKN